MEQGRQGSDNQGKRGSESGRAVPADALQIRRAKFLQDFLLWASNKDAACYLDQKMQTIAASSSSEEEQWLTLSQIGDKIRETAFETLEQYFAEIKKEVADNQKKHGIEKGLGVEKNGSNWRDRYFYKTTGPKIKTETNNSISEMSKATESQASSSAMVRADEADGRDEAKEVRQNTKKAAKMLEGLMRLMQAAKGLLLQMKAIIWTNLQVHHLEIGGSRELLDRLFQQRADLRGL